MRVSRINTLLGFLILSTGLASRALLAQEQELDCPWAASRDTAFLRKMVNLFETPGGSRLGLAAAPTGSPAGFVTDKDECRALARAVIASLPKVYKGPPDEAKAQFKWLSLTYVRVGPYYAARLYMAPRPTDTFKWYGYTPVAIYSSASIAGDHDGGDDERGDVEHGEHGQHSEHRQRTLRYVGVLMM